MGEEEETGKIDVNGVGGGLEDERDVAQSLARRRFQLLRRIHGKSQVRRRLFILGDLDENVFFLVGFPSQIQQDDVKVFVETMSYGDSLTGGGCCFYCCCFCFCCC